MDNIYLIEAIKEAKIALSANEIPVGAVIVRDGQIISLAHNLKEELMDTTAHAEILAIREASRLINNWRLTGCDMYVTLEPCPMCAAAIAQSRLSKLYIGTSDIEGGGCGSVVNMAQNDALNYFVNINWLYDEECSKLLGEFFQKRRK